MPAISHPELLHTLVALALVSIASLVGSVSFALGKRLNAVVPYLIASATGALLATALFNLVPEALEHSSSSRVGYLLAAGFLFSFLLERILGLFFQGSSHSGEDPTDPLLARMHHGHERQQSSGHLLIANILLSGAVHSLVDGVGIAAAFASSHQAGVATTLAVLLHEVPHHIADVGVLIYSGIGKRRAIVLNLLATTGCATGGILMLALGSSVHVLTSTLLPVTAANFLYIAIGMLMPELQRENNRRRSLLQIAVLVATLALVVFTGRLLPEETTTSAIAQISIMESN